MMITVWIMIIGVALMIVGLPIIITWQMWQDEKEMKKKGLIK